MNPSEMMSHSSNWMDGGMLIWVVVGTVMVVLMILVLIKWIK